jgi:hypothetical protein
VICVDIPRSAYCYTLEQVTAFYQQTEPPPHADGVSSWVPTVASGANMLGNYVEVRFKDPEQTVRGELRRQTVEGVWVYYGWAEQSALHFFPQHRIIEIVDCGRRPS